ncbi:unnamed protein product [Bursaphelenchus xylophilus]|uniref:(pine wood nematode) hypothetical protein n=1 Tax=Bursaphelenchus xylophilus TaxID=6326 RepID=A0A1I7RKR0_BURXY|nr:unnamed protein product [Bursaphelenchus xylophilus]CAG9131144.1 unnamed protein product [Bursaphelenchus xylophilus]
MGRSRCLLLLLYVQYLHGFIINNKLIRDDGVKVFTVSSEIKGYNCRCGCNCAAEGIILPKPLPLPPAPFPDAPKQFHIQKHIKQNDCNCQCSCYRGQLPTEGPRIHTGNDGNDVHSEVTKKILDELKTTLSLPSDPTTSIPQSNYTLLKGSKAIKDLSLETPLTVIVPERFTRPTRVYLKAEDNTEETANIGTTIPVDDNKITEPTKSEIVETTGSTIAAPSTTASELPKENTTKLAVTEGPTPVVSDAGEKLTMVFKEPTAATSPEATEPSTVVSTIAKTSEIPEKSEKVSTFSVATETEASSPSSTSAKGETSEIPQATEGSPIESTSTIEASFVSSTSSGSILSSTELPGSALSLRNDKKKSDSKTTSVWTIVPSSAEIITTPQPNEASSPSSSTSPVSTTTLESTSTTEDTNKLGLEIVSTTVKSNEEDGSILTTDDLDNLKAIPSEANEDGESTTVNENKVTKTPEVKDDKMEKLKSILGKLREKLGDMKKKKEEKEDQAGEIEESIDNVATTVSPQEQYKQKVRELVRRLEAELERLKEKKRKEEESKSSSSTSSSNSSIASNSNNVKEEVLAEEEVLKSTEETTSLTEGSSSTTPTPIDVTVLPNDADNSRTIQPTQENAPSSTVSVKETLASTVATTVHTLNSQPETTETPKKEVLESSVQTEDEIKPTTTVISSANNEELTQPATSFVTSGFPAETTERTRVLTTEKNLPKEVETASSTGASTTAKAEQSTGPITSTAEENLPTTLEASQSPETESLTTELRLETTVPPTESPFRFESNDVNIVTEGKTLATTPESVVSTTEEKIVVTTPVGNKIENSESLEKTKQTEETTESAVVTDGHVAPTTDQTTKVGENDDLSSSTKASVATKKEKVVEEATTETVKGIEKEKEASLLPTTQEEENLTTTKAEGPTAVVTNAPRRTVRPYSSSEEEDRHFKPNREGVLATKSTTNTSEDGKLAKSSISTHLEEIVTAKNVDKYPETLNATTKLSSSTTTLPTPPFNPKEIPERETTETTVTTESTTSEPTTTFIPEKETAAPTTPKTTVTTLETTTTIVTTTTTTEAPVTKKISSDDSSGPSFVVADVSKETLTVTTVGTTISESTSKLTTEGASTTTGEATEGLILTSDAATSTFATSEAKVQTETSVGQSSTSESSKLTSEGIGETSEPSTSQPSSTSTLATATDQITTEESKAATNSLPKEEPSFSIDDQQQHLEKPNDLPEPPPFFPDGLPGIAKLPKNADEHTLMERHKEARRWREKLELEKLHENVEGQVKFQNPAERRRLIEEKLDQLARLERYYHERLEQFRLAQRARANNVEEAPIAKPILTTPTTTTTVTPTTLDPSLPSHCAPVVKFISTFHIDDPHEWLKGNCVFVKEYFPGASCSQIEDLLAVCFNS